VDDGGREVILRGMGLGGWMLQEGYMLGINKEGTQHSIKARITDLVGKEDCAKFYQLWRQNHMSRADVELLAKSGFNSIRLPMHYNLFTLPIEEEPIKGGNTWLETGFAMIDSLLAWCKANQMFLILDLHAAPGGQGKDANISDYDPAKPSLWESGLNREKTIALWRKLAERYAREPWIGGYDLLNEPNWTFEGKDKNGREDTRNEPLWELYQAISKAVREVDTNHIVIIEGNGWGNNYNGFAAPWDSNMVLSFHKYWNPNTQEAITRFLALREKHGVPLWLGESGENNDQWFRDCVALVETNHIGWAWWPHKKVNSGSCTLTIQRPDDFRKVVEYWNQGGDRPSREIAAKALFELAENAKAENCRFNTNVIQALIPPSAESLSRPAGRRGEMTLWYRQPAVKWLEALPLGNGLTAAMVFGGTKTERIALNNSSFWSGKPHDYDDPNAGQYFDQIKALMAEKKFQEAEKMADDHFWGIPSGQQAYQPIGDLSLAFDGVGEASDYRRELDLETGVATVTFRSGGVLYTRETFISYPDRVLVMRISADKPGSVSVDAGFKSPAAFVDKLTAAPGKLVLDGTWRRPSSQTNWLIAPVEGEGLRFEVTMAARAEGGQSEATTDSMRIRNADAVTLILTTATSYRNYHDISGDPAAQCRKMLADCAGKDYAGLRRRHEADFRGLMGRVHLHVGDAAQNDKPIDERLAAVKAGTRDPNLEALVFQFGRYLLAASSRAGGQPANLQGIWNEEVLPPWGSKYTININTEMNYWPAEVCNLPECAQPLFDMIQDISETGAKTAKVYYGVDGWVTHHNIDLWRGTAPVDAARFGMWPVGGAWLCQSIWEHYAFGGDVDFLRRYYPMLRDCARFLLNIMIEEPKHHWLVTPFSMSPEHGYFDADGKPAVLSPSPTMDVAIMRELFPHCIEASRILGVDAEFRAKLEDALMKMPPYQIGSSGFVQEWIEDWKTGPQGHNVSPNFAFYPGCSITLRGNPEFAAAYQKWMEAHRPGGGFILPWGIAMWARLERGDEVAKGIEAYMGRCPAPNLHNAGANQSDASFGFTAAVAEALVQSHAGEVSLLPALPAGWNEGSVSGLRARAGYDVSMQWKNGKLHAADLHNLKGGTVKVRYGQKAATVTLKPGEAAHLNAELAPAN
jgi:alpha-L-fucosidase 2